MFVTSSYSSFSHPKWLVISFTQSFHCLLSVLHSPRHGHHPHRINLKQRIHHRLPRNPRTLHQDIQPIFPLALRIQHAVIAKRLPGNGSEFLKLVRERRGFETRDPAFEIREEG